ncbi:putative kinesin-like protein [Helianthus debilis subsp. tardiflorus]
MKTIILDLNDFAVVISHSILHSQIRLPISTFIRLQHLMLARHLQGRNGPVFYYGATGAGKTFTMPGTVKYPGVMVLAIKDLSNKV